MGLQMDLMGKKMCGFICQKRILQPLITTVGGAVQHKMIVSVWPVMTSKGGMDLVGGSNSGNCVFCSPVRLRLTAVAGCAAMTGELFTLSVKQLSNLLQQVK